MNITTKILLLLGIPVTLIVVFAIFLTHQGSEQVILLEAKKTASVVARQVVTDRKHYVHSVAKKLGGSDFAAKEGYTADSTHVPLPATFVMNVAADISESQDEYSYKLVSRWNANPGNALEDDFLQTAFAELEEQEKKAKADGQLSADQKFTNWQPYSQVMEIDGKRILRYLSADVAVGMACVTCHNGIEQREDVKSMRSKFGTEPGRTFQLNDLMGAIAVDVSLEEAGAIANANATQMTLWLIGSGALTLLCGFFFVRTTVARPINGIVASIREIATGDGDLTVRVDSHRTDELGELAKWFNAFTEKVHGVVTEVAESAENVKGASSDIALSSDQLANGINQQTDQTNQVSAAIEQMSATINDIARQSADTVQNAHDAGTAATEGGQIVAQTVESIREIAELVSDATQAVEQLGERSEEIGQVINVINDIADQTNLLALNAAIEAARAGEHGRGFAVVADEVRKLAERTTQATTEVGDSINGIQSQTDAVVQRMSIGNEKVALSVNNAEIAGQTLSSIVENTKQVADKISCIAAAAEEQSQTSDTISQNIEKISSVSQQSAESTQQSAQSTTKLNEKAEQLLSTINQFQY